MNRTIVVQRDSRDLTTRVIEALDGPNGMIGLLQEATAARDLAVNAATDASSSEGIATDAASDAVQARNDAQGAQGLAETARDAALDAKGLAEAARDDAVTAEGASSGHAANALLAQSAAEAARDAATVNAGVYADTAAGLVGTSEGDQFQVVSGDEIIRYRHDAGPVATEVARYPAAARVDALRAIQQVGRKSNPTAGSAGSAATRAFNDPVAADGFLERVSLYANPGTILLMPFTLDVGESVLKQSGPSISIVIPEGTAQLRHFTEKDFGKFPVRAGEYIGWFSPSSVLHGTGTSAPGYYNSSGGAPATQISTATTVTTNQPQIQFTVRAGTSVLADEKLADINSAVVELDVKSQLVLDRHRDVTVLKSIPADVIATRTEAILIDKMDVAEPVPVASGPSGEWVSGDYDPTFTANAGRHYHRLGNMGYEARRGAIYPVPPSGAFDPGPVGSSALMWGLDPVWYETQQGCEIRAKFFIPMSIGSNIPGVYLLARMGNGNYIKAVITLNIEGKTQVVVSTLSDIVAGTVSSQYLFTEDAPNVARNIEMVLRIFGEDLFTIEIQGLGLTNPQFRNGIARSGRFQRGLWSGGVSSVGFGFNHNAGSYRGANCHFLEIRPIPQMGSTWYRPLPPEPAPIVPPIAKGGEIWSTAMSAFGTGQFLNFSVVNMDRIASDLGISPVDNYYAYYSSDHAEHGGGIWLATAPSPTGPWTTYVGSGADGRIYIDTFAGDQTETPVVRYDANSNRLLMMYQQRSIPGETGQKSVMAESPDGITWDRLGVASTADKNDKMWVHDGYSCFFKDPLGVVPGWPAFWRQSGGGGGSRWGVAHSDDGVHFTPDHVPLRMPALYHQTRASSYIIDCPGYGTAPFAYRGQRLLPISPFRGPGVGPEVGYVAIVTLGDDMRNMSAVEHIIEPSLPTETGKPTIADVLVEDDKAYIYVVWGMKSVHVYVADLAAPPPGSGARPF